MNAHNAQPEVSRMPRIFSRNVGATEQLHRLRRSISQHQADSEHTTPTVGICSSNTREGATTTLLNLATQAVNLGERVLMIDANLRSPRLHAMFNLKPAPGFTDLILSRASHDKVVQRTGKEKLFLVSCGSVVQNTESLLNFPGLPMLIGEFRRIADLVLVDLPPVNQSIEAGLVGQALDQVYLVIQAEKSRWEVVSNARDQLNSYSVNLCGAVLNRRRHYIPEWLYNKL